MQEAYDAFKFKNLTKNFLYSITILMLLGFVQVSKAQPLSPVDTLLNEARQKRNEGDLKGASILYQSILDKDANHSVARKELAAVIMKSQSQYPDGDISEATTGVLEQIKTKKQNSKIDNPPKAKKEL